MAQPKKSTKELISQILSGGKKLTKSLEKKPRKKTPKHAKRGNGLKPGPKPKDASKKRIRLNSYSDLESIYKLINETQLHKVENHFLLDEEKLLPTLLNILKDLKLDCIHEKMKNKIYIKILPNEERLGSDCAIQKIDKFFNYQDIKKLEDEN